MRNQDVGLVFFSGHGAYRDNTFYMLSVDANVDDLESTTVPTAQFKHFLATTKGNLVVLLDACHSGAQAAMLPPRIPDSAGRMVSTGHSRRASEIARVIAHEVPTARLAAGRREATSTLDRRADAQCFQHRSRSDHHDLLNRPRGLRQERGMEAWLLRAALTEGLSGKADINNDGLVYLTELDAYLVNRVQDLSSNRQHPTTSKPPGVRPFVLSRSRP